MSKRHYIVPCIDVMDGRVVQLVQGKRKALELESPDVALDMFVRFPLLHVIDLDAASGKGDNSDLVRHLVTRAHVRVGGGVRSVERAKRLIDLGAKQVIVGSAAFEESGIDETFLRQLSEGVGIEQIVLAIDCIGGRVAVNGWQRTLTVTPEEAIKQAELYCAGYLCTSVDREGLMDGTDLDLFFRLRSLTSKCLIAAGGISTMDEIRSLIAADVQVALGMAIYTGRLSLDELAAI